MLHTFYDTYNYKFPLMMVVGREPNNDDSSSQKTWVSEQFEDTQRCALWNQAHSIIASKFNQPITTQSIKRMCKDNQASPVLIADAIHQGLSNKNLPSEKKKIRLSIPTKAIEDHINKVFSEKSLIDRVKIVLMSGLNIEDFQRSREYYIKCFEKFIPNIPIIQTKFLYGTNMPDIREHIQKSVDGNSAIEHVTRSFELFVGQNKNR